MRVFPREEHRQHPGMAHRPSPPARLERARLDPKRRADRPFHVGEPHAPAARPHEVSQRLTGKVERDGNAEHQARGFQAIDGAKKFTGMPRHVCGHVVNDIVGNLQRTPAANRGHDAPPDLVVGRHQPRIHPTPQPRQEIRPEFRQGV